MVIRLRNHTSMLASNGAWVWQPGRLIKYCKQGFCHVPCSAGEQGGIFFFIYVPRHAVRKLHPAVVRIHPESERLVKIK